MTERRREAEETIPTFSFPFHSFLWLPRVKASPPPFLFHILSLLEREFGFQEGF